MYSFDSNYFSCERHLIEAITQPNQKNILIQLYCSPKFAFIDLVDFYYRGLKGNAILLFIVLIISYPFLFLCIASIAEKYLAVGMRNIADKFRLSPTLAAVTLLALANGSPDLISAFTSGGKEDGALISLCTIYGGYIFSGTLVIANVAFNSKEDIKLPKLAVIKELSFYLFSILVIILFALRGISGYTFIATYLGIYFVYIIITLKMEDNKAESPTEDHESITEVAIAVEQPDPQTDDFSYKDDFYTFELCEESADDDMSKSNTGKNTDSIFVKIMHEIAAEEHSGLEVILLMPLHLTGLFTIPYQRNPFMTYGSRFIVCMLSLVFSAFSLQIVEANLRTAIVISCASGLLLILLDVFILTKEAMSVIYELISVFAAVAWIKIFGSVIIDFIFFMAFYFNINEIILACLLLSAGNTIGEFFSNGALASSGNAVMGAMASYSGQIMINFVGFSINIFVGLSVTTDFDLFSLYKADDEDLVEVSSNHNSLFIILLMIVVVALLIFKLAYYFANNFTIGKKFIYTLLGIYVSFFCSVLLYGILTKKDSAEIH